MKKLISLFSILITLLILTCVAPTKVNAEESTWYTEAAERAGNPVLLEDKQYFQGISINSNIISDLTFMEIPFTKYTDNKTSKVQIITFTEALYRNDDENHQEVAMYVYYPNKYVGYPKDYIETQINFKSQKYLYGSSFVDGLTYEKYNSYMVTWTKVSSYGNIVKYSFGKYSDNYGKHEITDILLKDYSTASTTEIQTIFDAKIIRFGIYAYTENDGSEYYYKNQEFQLILNKKNVLEASPLMRLANTQKEVNHTAACVSTNTDTVSVTGKAVKYRYLSELSNKLGFIQVKYEDTYIDINYLFFNVEDFEGKKWGSEVFISEVNLNYVLANVSSTHFFKDTDWSKLEEQVKNMNGGTNYSMNFINSNGEIVYQSEKNSDFQNSELLADFNSYLKDETLFHSQKIVPDKITFEYLEDSVHNQFVSYFAGFYNTRKATYMTLFNTDSEEFRQYCDLSENHNSDLLLEYQFGLVYGNSNGYPVRQNVKDEGGFWGVSRTIVQDYTLISISDIIDIEYVENGEIHRITVSETNIDNSNIVTPTLPKDDIWEDEPGTPRPKKDATGIWAIIQKIIEFFTITLPNWWKESKTAIIGVLISVGVVIIVIFLWRFLSPIITAIATKKAVEKAVKKNNKEE